MISGGNRMKTETYLELIRKLDMLINNELLEKERLFTLATKTVQELSDMPHATGTSDKVGNAAVKLSMMQQKINHTVDVFVDLKTEIISQIRILPADECDVLYKYYVLGQGLFDIAEERGQSVDWIKKLKWRGISKIKVIQSEAYNQACALLFSENDSHF